jgi:hypothetical protein
MCHNIASGFDESFAIFGLAVFVRQLGANLAALRDRAAQISIDHPKESASELMRLHADVAALNIDLLPVIDEVALLAEDDSAWPRKPTDDFIRLYEGLRNYGGLLKAVRDELREHGKRLALQNTAVRDSVDVTATALHARIQADASDQNIGLQRSMKLLTLATILLALLSLFVGLPKAIEDWMVFLPKLLTKISALAGY